VQSYASGARILSQGEKYTALIILLAGRATARFYEYSGRTVLVETLEAPAPVASAVLFSSDPHLPVTLEAESDVRAAVIDKRGVELLFSIESQVMTRFLGEMGDKVQFLAEKVRMAELAGIRQRLADYLLRLYSRNQSLSFLFPLSREKMAEMFGVARPSVSREMSRMCDEGIISVSGRAVTILDTEELENLLEL